VSISGPDLYKLFADLPGPSATDAFVAIKTPAHPSLRIGRSPRGTPVLLVRLQKGTRSFLPGTHLANLSADYSVPCTIEVKGTGKEDGVFAIVEYTGQDVALRNYFFMVGASLLGALPDNPTPVSVRNVVTKFVDLFSLLAQASRNSVQGLWAELFLIASACDPRKALDCWHRDSSERYDFSLGSDRIEAKSYSGARREHHFALEQLRHSPDLNVIICSMNVRPSGGGTSIGDLRDKIIRSLAGNSERIFHLEEQISACLGAGLPLALSQSFDAEVAHDSLGWFEAKSIPAVSRVSEFVSNVHFISDLTSAPQCALRIARHNTVFRLLL